MADNEEQEPILPKPTGRPRHPLGLEKRSVTIPQDILLWVQDEIVMGRFDSLSGAIRQALRKMMPKEFDDFPPWREEVVIEQTPADIPTFDITVPKGSGVAAPVKDEKSEKKGTEAKKNP